jgi:hypothetical protein
MYLFELFCFALIGWWNGRREENNACKMLHFEMPYCLKYLKVNVAMNFHRNVDCGNCVEPRTFRRCRKDPILFSFQTFEVELDDIPFPSVSACDSSSLQNTQVENINR